MRKIRVLDKVRYRKSRKIACTVLILILIFLPFTGSAMKVELGLHSFFKFSKVFMYNFNMLAKFGLVFALILTDGTLLKLLLLLNTMHSVFVDS